MSGLKKKTGYTVSYSGFRGVELGASCGDDSRSRLEYAENLWRDYSHDSIGAVESIPGFRRIRAFGAKIHDIIFHKITEGHGFLLVHAGGLLYRLSESSLEGEVIPAPIASLDDRKCTHFVFGKSLYFFSSHGITEIGEGGEVKTDEDGHSLYTPTLTLNGRAYEQRNLLNTRWKTKHLLNDVSSFTRGSPGITYKILDKELKCCTVTGLDRYYSGVLYVPSATTINGIEYRVTEIAPKAFLLNTLVTEIHIAEGVEVIGDFAFKHCTAAKQITIPCSVRSLGIGTFENCQSMTDLYIGSGIERFGTSQFVECKVLERLHYAGTKEMLEDVEGSEFADELEIVYLDSYGLTSLELPLAREADEVISVTENGSPIEFEEIRNGTGLVQAVKVSSERAGRETVEYEITANSEDSQYSFNSGGSTTDGRSAIIGCRIAEAFDNRIFLSGNPDLPNTVFFSSPIHASSDNPLYFGELNYFNAGIGTYTNRAMLAVGDSLAVFKSGDDGTGSIFYYFPEDAENDYIPRVYKRTFVHSGISAGGGAISFMDDPVFLTRSGLYALAKKNINYDRNVVCRSHNVNRDLQKEDLSRAIMVEWCGYLVIFTGTNAYLADSRATFTHKTGAAEYEWFILKGIGSYSGDEPVYRFDSVDTERSIAHPTPGEIFEGVAYSFVDSAGAQRFYGNEGGADYTVYPTSEKRGGILSPVSAACSDGDMLYFGTEEGVLCKFNNDLRGEAPPEIRAAEGFDEEEYRREMGDMLHPEFYAFDRHAVRYALKTVYDNCGIPHLTKDTVKNSLVLKCRCAYGTKLHVEVGTEGRDYKEIAKFPGGAFSFAELNFEQLCLDTTDTHTVPIREKEKDWIEKQITVYTDGYASPIGIYMIAYRYRISGRVKKN